MSDRRDNHRPLAAVALSEALEPGSDGGAEYVVADGSAAPETGIVRLEPQVHRSTAQWMTGLGYVSFDAPDRAHRFGPDAALRMNSLRSVASILAAVSDERREFLLDY